MLEDPTFEARAVQNWVCAGGFKGMCQCKPKFFYDDLSHNGFSRFQTVCIVGPGTQDALGDMFGKRPLAMETRLQVLADREQELLR